VSRSFSFHPAARAETREAVRFYETAQEGPGAELVVTLRTAIDQVLVHPPAGRPGPAGTRRVVLGRFPYTWSISSKART
jgi:plasmid stabilization system protein ParE